MEGTYKLLSRAACAGLAVAALAVFSATPAFGQLHGFEIAKGCLGPYCDGEEVICDIQFGYNDDFGDTLRIHAAWDIEDVTGDMHRVPAEGPEVIGDTFADGTMIGDDDGICEPFEVCEGNLMIVGVSGNTSCMVGGALPCEIGPGGSSLSGLPGDPENGSVMFEVSGYFVQPDDPDPLRDQATILYEDLCDSPTTANCGGGILNMGQAPGSTPITRCDDGNECTTDSCESGVCSNIPDCETDVDCDDGDACTDDVCTAEGCCESTPTVCDDGDPCTNDSCDPATGCVFEEVVCDDESECTTDECVDGICIFTEIMCDDENACTADSCDPAVGCVYEDISPQCDDMNVCTEDSCDPLIGCVYVDTSAECDDMNVCTDDSCDPIEGCMYEDNSARCDDGDECTDDTCDPIEGCVYVDNGTCVDFGGCTPGFWKQPHHLQYWEVYNPDDLYNDVFGIDARPGVTLLDAMWTGGGGEFALGRHAVAALLNATSGDVMYAYTVDEIIAGVQDAYATGEFNMFKDTLDYANNAGCTVIKDNSMNGDLERDRKRTRG